MVVSFSLVSQQHKVHKVKPAGAFLFSSGLLLALCQGGYVT